MATRTLNSSPSMLALYGRSALAMLPGTSRLPFVPGSGREIPELELALAALRVKGDALAAYARVCGFELRDELPPTCPHVLAFPLHMAIMADGRFPFGAVGLVHVRNRIVQHRAISPLEELEIRVRPTPLEPHPRGRVFALCTEVLVGTESVWESESRFLRRGGGPTSERTAPNGSAVAESGSQQEDSVDVRGGGETELEQTAEWRLGSDAGRRYAAVSGDRNPIHMHSLTARAFGFPRAIAHGMWVKARCLAALESRLGDSRCVEVRFRKPILLPARVRLESGGHGGAISFAVRDSERGATHLEGSLEPVQTRNEGSDER